MPYISQEQRKQLEKRPPENAGELNYILTTIIMGYLSDPNYQRYNDVVGVLTCIQHEIYRRQIADYEDLKIKENGDL
jgi:hypothetical protein